MLPAADDPQWEMHAATKRRRDQRQLTADKEATEKAKDLAYKFEQKLEKLQNAEPCQRARAFEGREYVTSGMFCYGSSGYVVVDERDTAPAAALNTVTR